MDLRESGTISSLTDHSINDLVLSKLDSTTTKMPLASMKANFQFKNSRVPFIEVSEHPTGNAIDGFHPLFDVSNATPTSPVAETATSAFPATEAAEIPALAFDGPASIPIIIRDFAHTPDACPPIPGIEELSGDTGSPLKMQSLQKPTPGPPITDNELPLNNLDNITMVDGAGPKLKAPDVPAMPGLPDNPCLPSAPCLPGLPPVPSLPNFPVDATGLEPAPAMPLPNLSKKQRIKVKGQKALRKGRRIVLRKCVLSAILGRQLAGPTSELLKVISKGGSGAIGVATIAAPVRGLVLVPL